MPRLDTGRRPARMPLRSEPQEADDLRTLVTIVRNDPEDVAMRQIVTRIDALPKVTLMFGDSWTAELEPGAHRLRVHNTLVWKTVPFTVEPGEHLEFVVINRSGRISFAFLAMLGASPLFLTIKRRSLR
jgi:hypothetical protein